MEIVLYNVAKLRNLVRFFTQFKHILFKRFGDPVAESGFKKSLIQVSLRQLKNKKKLSFASQYNQSTHFIRRHGFLSLSIHNRYILLHLRNTRNPPNQTHEPLHQLVFAEPGHPIFGFPDIRVNNFGPGRSRSPNNRKIRRLTRLPALAGSQKEHGGSVQPKRWWKPLNRLLNPPE